MSSPDDEVRFQRSGFSNPLGKYDIWFEKFRFDSESMARLQLKAAQRGMPVAEYARFVLHIDAWGVEHVKSVYLARFEGVGQTEG